ncbi:hydroxyisourate hydrolase [Vibrio neptunius]|uniref:5-hydroxyisourate hydrolase n=1 Tax=Vibrio neptunius TaxID=170651 RepID=A0ABS2ZZI9_9VIBR|nr:hydroxyisourate hydrolase [Vibrio neptunius]MBN3492870.1 hydroxyisourate hydrolase [Vibrio neptunius]MBN3515412.1 hydroxyisourate hydrolase [Vibrio neptunius]MBN3549402.1 hydroxyisourate hydrolase [Vibrio neptunius]MBN3573669.1 hydroxyisourate hydrolase [Vibrio neptunius]MBN3577671.1 hydroxyisourate hydrolase [Vibrio neptunius]
MGKLTTHVLDTMHGLPGAGIQVELFRVEGSHLTKMKTVTTNFDGRTDEPVLEGENFELGKYQLVFHVADYFRSKEVELGDIAFLDDVVIRFGLGDKDAHYHVPLLVSPYSFSTYRGS